MNRDYLRGSFNRRDELGQTITPFTEWSTGAKFGSTSAQE